METMTMIEEALTPVVERLNSDVKLAVSMLRPEEARFLVDYYYTMQKNRIRAGNQSTAMAKTGEPSKAVDWLMGQSENLENRVKLVLHHYSNSQPLGRWARLNVGIGPVIAAGLLAHIDITKAVTAGAVWRFAGLEPSVKWDKGQVRPWNARLKTLCWKIGESFTKVCNNEEAVYGRVYAERKALEIERNEAGAFEGQARASLSEKNYGKDTTARKRYEEGRLPDARLHLRAQRCAVKLFLSHYWEVGRRLAGLEVCRPFVIEHRGHVHYIPPPHFNMETNEIEAGPAE